MSDVDFIVLDIDGGAMLEECLASIAAQTLRPARVIVVDNGSQVPVRTRQLPDLGGIELTVVRLDRNRGFAGGVNEGVARSAAPYVALVNNDVVLDREWLAAVRDAMGPRIAGAQTIIGTGSGTIDGAGIDTSDGTLRQLGHGRAVGTPLLEPFGASATAALYRRELVRFDERFFAYYEDVELAARLAREGWRFALVPRVLATHRGSASASHLGSQALYLRTRNRYFVARLHPNVARVGALLIEDLKLLLRGQSSVRGIIEGLTHPLRDSA